MQGQNLYAPRTQLLIIHVWERNGTPVYQYSNGLCCAAVGKTLSIFFQVDEWDEPYWRDEQRKNMLNAGQQK